MGLKKESIKILKLSSERGTMTYCLDPNEFLKHVDLCETYMPNGYTEIHPTAYVAYMFYI